MEDFLFRKLFSSTDDLVILLDERGRIREGNDVAIERMGPEILGKMTGDLFNGIADAVAGAYGKTVAGAYGKTVAEGNAVERSGGERVGRNFRARARFGKSLGRMFKVSLVPIPDGAMLVCRDIEEIDRYMAEIGRLRNRIEVMEKTRKAAPRTPEETNARIEELNVELKKELELAARFQKSLVPLNVPEQCGMRFAFHYEPVGMVGGDFADVAQLGEWTTGLIIADVSGHDISSAFITAMLKVSFNNYASISASPSKLLQKLNRDYCTVIQTGDYVTAFYLEFDSIHDRIVYSGAGHPAPMVLRKDGKVELLESEGFFIGMFESAEYGDMSTHFRKGDRCLVYTDGLSEAYADELDEQYGTDRIVECFRKGRNEPIESAVEGIAADVKRFIGQGRLYDDFTMVGVDFRD